MMQKKTFILIASVVVVLISIWLGVEQYRSQSRLALDFSQSAALGFPRGGEDMLTFIRQTDRTSPIVSIVSPVSKSYLAGVANVIVRASDDTAVRTLSLYLDNSVQPLQTKFFIAYREDVEWVFQVDTKKIADGQHTFSVLATDRSGNRSTPAGALVFFDNTPPQVQITSPPPSIGSANATVVRGRVQLTVATRDNSGIKSAVVYLYGNTPAATIIARWALGGPTATVWDTTQYPDGSYRLQAQAIDMAGNVAFSPAVYVNVVNKLPLPTEGTCESEVDCAGPPEGCYYQGGDRCSCGQLKCDAVGK